MQPDNLETAAEIESPSCCVTLTAKINDMLSKKDNEQIAYTVSTYAIGDAIWSYFSYLNLGINLQSTNDTAFSMSGQWAGQQLYATVGMGIFSGVIAARYGLKKEYPKAADVMTIFGAGALSIYTWDRAQTWGIEVFKNAGYSNDASGYFSSIFAGISEGLTQFIFIKLIKLFSDDAEYTHFRKDPRNYFLNLLIGLGLNSTIGAIPGAVWQLVFNAAAIGTIGAAATALSVAMCVALSAIVSAKAYHTILNSGCYTSYCGLPTPISDEKLASPASQCCGFLYSLFPPADNETQTDAYATPMLLNVGNIAISPVVMH